MNIKYNFIERFFSLIYIVLLSITISACDDNNKNKGKINDTEISPLGLNQTVNDILPFLSRNSDVDNSLSQNTTQNLVQLSKNATPASFNVDVTFNAGVTLSSTNSCQLILIQTQSAQFSSQVNIQKLQSMTYAQLTKLQIGSQYLDGAVAYADSLVLQTDLTTNQKFFRVENASVDKDFTKYTYFLVVTCLDSSSQTIYSDLANTRNLTENANGNVSDNDITIFKPARRTTEQAQPNPSQGMFTTNITFANNVLLPDASCQYLVVSVQNTQQVDKMRMFGLIFMTALVDMRKLQKGDTFLNISTVAYSNDNETLLQDPTGQVYVQANVPVSDIHFSSNKYYPILVCTNNLYSDFSNTVEFQGQDGQPIPNNNVVLMQPVVTLQPNDDVVFGDKHHNMTTPNSAFNENGSQYNFVLDLGNLPDPTHITNGACDYAVALDYSTAIASHATLQLPQTLADFQSLYAGKQFGNSEAKGVIAIVKNPPVHSGSQSGFYVGMRLSLPKPITSYVNVAYCTLGGRNGFAGYSLATDSTFNKDIAQVMHFNVNNSFPNNMTINSTEHLAHLSDISAFRPIFQPDSSISRDDIDEIGRTDCQGAPTMFSIADSADLTNITLTWNDVKTSTAMASFFNNQNSSWEYHELVKWNYQPLHIRTDYKDLYTEFDWAVDTAGASNTLTRNYLNSQTTSSGGKTKLYYIFPCAYGTNKHLVTDFSKAKPVEVRQDQTNNNRFIVVQKPYYMPVKAIN